MYIYSHELDNGNTIYAKQRGDFIEFINSATGDHRISADSTEDRVKAHWDGFVQNAERHVYRHQCRSHR